MADTHDIAIRVISQKGICDVRHKVGDERIIMGEKYKTPQGICLFAFSHVAHSPRYYCMAEYSPGEITRILLPLPFPMQKTR